MTGSFVGVPSLGVTGCDLEPGRSLPTSGRFLGYPTSPDLCVPNTRVSSRRRLANEAMDLGDLHLGFAHL